MKPHDPTPDDIRRECEAIRAEKRRCNTCGRPNTDVVLWAVQRGGWVCETCRSIEETDDDLDDLYAGE